VRVGGHEEGGQPRKRGLAVIAKETIRLRSPQQPRKCGPGKKKKTTNTNAEKKRETAIGGHRWDKSVNEV